MTDTTPAPAPLPPELPALPPGIEAVDAPHVYGGLMVQVVRAAGRLCRRTVNLATGDSALQYLD